MTDGPRTKCDLIRPPYRMVWWSKNIVHYILLTLVIFHSKFLKYISSRKHRVPQCSTRGFRGVQVNTNDLGTSETQWSASGEHRGTPGSAISNGCSEHPEEFLPAVVGCFLKKTPCVYCNLYPKKLVRPITRECLCLWYFSFLYARRVVLCYCLGRLSVSNFLSGS